MRARKILVWWNFQNEIIEIVAGDEEEYLQLVDEISELGEIVFQSSDGYYVSLRNGRSYISPHLYNTMGEIDALLDLLRFYT